MMMMTMTMSMLLLKNYEDDANIDDVVSMMRRMRMTQLLMTALTTLFRVAFLGDTRLVTIGQDGTLLQWAVY